MEKKRLRVLFFNLSKSGVYYYRSLTPAMEIDRLSPDDIFVELNYEIDFTDPNTINYLKSFDVIHYYRHLVEDKTMMLRLKNELSKEGVVFVMDIDDYWVIDRTHPFYELSMKNNLREDVEFNLSVADYVTTTTDLLADEIRKVTKKDNVYVFYNSVNPEWMHQFKNNWKEDPNGLVRITYMAGSSHKNDIEQLRGVVNVLQSDVETKNKFKIIVAGWDTSGSKKEIKFNQEFADELRKLGILNKKMIDSINKSKGDIDLIVGLSDELKEKYRDNVHIKSERKVRTDESAYWFYERILTNDHRLIQDKNYFDWLMTFDTENQYENEDNFGRRWTENINKYAQTLNETDIVIAPLVDNKFNRLKSNLKQVEAWSRRLPVVCSDIPPYNVDGKHMENCILIPTKKNAHKYWKKELKKLILDKNLRTTIGEGLYRDFSKKYNLEEVTKNRINFYKLITKKS